MIARVCLLIAALWAVSPTPGVAADVETWFTEAARFYDDRDYEKAANLYREALAHGHPYPDVFFNLGNAQFRQGQLGEAVLSYRRAWMMAPRDPDIEANLRFALEASGGVLPPPSLLETVTRELTRREWTLVMMAGYWLTALALLAAMILPPHRRIFVRLAVLCVLLTALGWTGRWSWTAWENQREAVVIAPDARTLYAPYSDATPAFTLPEGSVVQILEESGDWVRVRSGSDSGWIERSIAPHVYPWTFP